jgi:hypothetical protein
MARKCYASTHRPATASAAASRKERTLLYADDDHVSVYGAALIAPLLTEALRKP